ncbi:1,4-alpha-glucan branching protein [Streptomyces sp. PCS3-D2]|uniref:maltokinase N-terminal cap-like domain-containing protein n=1 Tax=Streptomyces sp. PCS3-D2 TaxID=1460244 RepID=UPI00044FC07E|nr:hypothetical protein [Streptomyces sp. PCS3-D2]WKV70942.1 1,4-alpha-glucan branching protein [Streptomyces sp. PCS3-D2]
MAVIHRTTMSPGKLELIAAWLPSKPWYRGGDAPLLAKAGGFRLDDPAGEVGIEFMVVTDTSGGVPVTYQVPMTYRGTPLEHGEDALIGTSEHGVLGLRWIYDGAHDPVLVAQLLALLAGRAAAQDQNASDAPDPAARVLAEAAGVPEGLAGPKDATDTSDATVVGVAPAGRDEPVRALSVSRVLAAGPAVTGGSVLAQLLNRWTDADAGELHGVFAVLHAAKA